MEANTFIILSLIIFSGAVFSFIAFTFRQPLILGYILSGIFLGPLLGVIDPTSNQELIRVFSEIGLTFLLFSVGLELDLSRLKRIGLIATLGGLTRIGLSFSFGYFIGGLLGLSLMESIYFGLILSFASTMVVVKLLSDHRELDTLHGRTAVGLLLIEDLVAVLSITILANTNNIAHIVNLAAIIKNIGLFILLIILSRLTLPLIFKQAAKNSEALFVLSVGFAMLFAILSPLIGFPMAIGVFTAGILLGNLPYSVEINSRLRPLKDFFLLMFFVSLGLSFSFVNFSQILKPMIVAILFALVINPIVITLISLVFGYTSKTSFFTGLLMGEISEFALIILSQGLLLNHISEKFYSLGVVAAIITMTIATYNFKYRYQIYMFFKPILKRLERIFRKSPVEDKYLSHRHHDVILIGYDRIGYGILRKLLKMKKDVVVVDYNPDVISRLIEHNIPSIYADISDPETIEELNLRKAKMVISTAPNVKDNLYLIKKGKRLNKDLIVIATAQTVEDALELYKAGADYVILPHLLGGEHAAVLLEEVGENIDKLIATKIQHIKELRLKKELHPRHL